MESCFDVRRRMTNIHLIITVVVLSVSLFSPIVLGASNLLLNGSFELPVDADGLPPGWNVFAGEIGKQMWIQGGQGFDGSRAFVVDSGGSGNAGIRSLPIPAHSGEIFDASVMVYPSVGNRPALHLEYLNEDYERVASKSVSAPPSGKWERLRVSLEAPKDRKWVSVILFASAAFNPGRSVFDQATLSRGLPYVVNLTTDKPEALYGVDEDVTFIIQVQRGGVPVDDPTVEWLVTNDGPEWIGFGISRPVNGEVRVTQRLDRPGFLRMEVTVSGSGGRVVAQVGAGVDPHLIKPSMPPPDDFDDFWNEKKAALAAIPVDAQLTPVNPGTTGIELFDVRVDSLGAPVSGYMARPSNAKEGSLPAILTLHGAGYVSASKNKVIDWAQEGLLALDINAHGIPNGQSASFYTKLGDSELYRYWWQGRESRETFYFLGMFLRVVRAIDFLTAQPEWDGKTLILYGTSQGGAQAMAGAGLDERVSFFVAGVPGMADLTGMVVGRPMGWPNMSDISGMPSPHADAIVETLRYFDGMNFMTRTKADGFFTVGFVDSTCRPTTVYAAYNALHNDKDIYNDIFAGHENTPEAIRYMREAVHRHILKMNKEN